MASSPEFGQSHGTSFRVHSVLTLLCHPTPELWAWSKLGFSSGHGTKVCLTEMTWGINRATLSLQLIRALFVLNLSRNSHLNSSLMSLMMS